MGTPFVIGALKMNKQRAFYEWIEKCPVDLSFVFDFPSKDNPNCTDEMYIFRNIPNVEKNNDN